MTTRRLTCSCGHSWDHSVQGPLPADLRAICPVCTTTGANTMAAPVKARLTEATVELPALGADPGGGLAGFEILGELNRGGMGVIYKARQQGLNRLVALKVIMPERLGHADTMKRFQREVQAAALLSHPNIVTVFHTDLDGPRPFLAMEYVAGIDLHKLVNRVGPLPASEACSYILQAAEGLQHAFEQGLVHRDIKPANLMVTPSPLDTNRTRTGRPPRVKILDMGLARLTTPLPGEGEGGLTQAGEFLGTPDFIAPEQAEDSRNADVRSDLYSLGGTLYFLLTGEVPFPSSNVLQKLRRQLTEPPPSPAARQPDVPPGVDAVVRRLLARNPAERFQTPEELIEVLSAVLRDPSSAARLLARTGDAELPVGTRSGDRVPRGEVPAPTGAMPAPPPSSRSTVSQVRAHSGGVQSLCLSIDGQLLLSGGLDQTLRLWEAGRLREIRCLTEGVGPVEQVCIAPKTKWAASCSLRQSPEDMVVQLWDLATGKEHRRLPGLTDTIRCVAISPDGRSVAAGGADKTIRIWTVSRPGSPSIALPGHTDQVNSVVFLPGSDALLSGSSDGTVRLWDVKTGAAKGTLMGQVGAVAAVAFEPNRQLALAGEGLRLRKPDGSFRQLKGHQGSVLGIAFSPDGRLLVSGGSDKTVRLWRTEDGQELHCFQDHTDKVRAVVFSPDGQTVYSGSADGTIRRWPVPS